MLELDPLECEDYSQRVASSFFIFLFSSNFVFAVPDASATASTSSKNSPVVLTVFPPPEPPRDKNANVVGVELAFALAGSSAPPVRFVHLAISSQIHELAIKASEAIERWKPALIIGGSTSNAAFVLSDLAETHKIPLITPWATHPRLTENKSYTLRVCFDDNYQALKLAEFAVKEKRAQRAVVLVNRKETFSIGVTENFSRKFTDLGGQIVGRVDFAEEREIDRAAISRVVQWKPDLVFIPSYEMEVAALMTRLVGLLPEKTIYLGADSWGGSQLIRGVLDRLKLQPQAYFVEHWSREHSSPGNKIFLEAIKTKALPYLSGIPVEAWLATPGAAGTSASGVALGYDAGLIALQALKREGLRAENLLGALRRVELEGATGRFNFEKSATPDKGLFVYNLERGRVQFVKAYQ